MNNQLHLCGTDETKEVTPTQYTMDSIDRILGNLARQIEQDFVEIQQHAQRLPSEFGFGATTEREPHIVGYQAQRSLESIGDKVRRTAMLQEQHLALVLLRRELVWALDL